MNMGPRTFHRVGVTARGNPQMPRDLLGPVAAWAYNLGLKRGDKIRFLAYAGRGMRGPEYKEVVGTIHLIGEAGPVVTIGSSKRASAMPHVVTEETYIGKAGRKKNPPSKRAQAFISRKIRRLAHEGMRAPRRIGAAYSMARRAGFRVPRKGNPGASEKQAWFQVHDIAILMKGRKLTPPAAAAALERIVERMVAQLERGVHENPLGPIGEQKGRITFSERMAWHHLHRLTDHLYGLTAKMRGANRKAVDETIGEMRDTIFTMEDQLKHGIHENPSLAILGAANPPAKDAIRATWANLVYSRPDDPEGPRAVREHEFKDGFIATPLKDGRVVLSHPRGKSLWTRR